MTQLEYVDYLKRKLDTTGVTYRKLNRYDDESMLFEKQKAEIERLTEETDQRRNMMQLMNCNYATELQKNTELQKRVDELKEQFLATCENCHLKKDIELLRYQKQQAVKDTADKIFRQVLKLYQGLSKAERETMTFEWKLLDLAVEYGVEVE